MRVHVAGTTSDLAKLMDEGWTFHPEAYALTPEVASRFYPAEDWREDSQWRSSDEFLLSVAKCQAAYRSLRELLMRSWASRRRVVIVADVPDEAVTPMPRSDYRARSEVLLNCRVPLSHVICVYVDDPDAEADIAKAADEIGLADLGYEWATVGADRHELRRYTVQEIPDLLRSMDVKRE